jgi:hypothetical protein
MPLSAISWRPVLVVEEARVPGERTTDHMFVWYYDLQLPVQSVPITTKIVSLNPVHGKVYSMQHYVIKFVSDLQQISGF